MDIQKFCAHVQAEGFLLYPERVKADGRWHNCRLVDNAPGKMAGAYKILNDSVAFYKNWRTGECKAFTDRSITSEYSREKLQRMMKNQEWELKQQYFSAAKASYEKYSAIERSANQSEYLQKKQVANYGAKIDPDGNLVIPFRNENGFIRTLQTISPDGTKMFEKGGEVKGNFHKIHFSFVDKLNNEYFGKIFIGEGYATMATIHEATKYPCVVAANAGNLKPVLEKMAEKYPHAQFVICADNDLSLRNEINGKVTWANPGVEAAINCLSVKTEKPISILIPDFSHITEPHKFTDFNDLHCSSGLSTVKNQINQQLQEQAKYNQRILTQPSMNYEVLKLDDGNIDCKDWKHAAVFESEEATHIIGWNDKAGLDSFFESVNQPYQLNRESITDIDEYAIAVAIKLGYEMHGINEYVEYQHINENEL